MVFLSEILGAEVIDVEQRRAGRVRDVAVATAEPYPIVTGVLLNPRRGLMVPWSTVRTIAGREIALRTRREDLRLQAVPEQDIWLARDVLDKQVIDTDGRRLVRVNDLQLQASGGQLLLVGVDIGARGLLRRLGAEGVARRLSRLLGRNIPQRLISWDAVDPVQSDEQSMKLRISHRKVAKMHPADIAEIVGQLGGRDRAAIFDSLDDETAADTLEESTDEIQAQILDRLDDERAADILEAMSPDEAADLLGDLPEERREQLIAKMAEDEAEDVEELLLYKDNSAGGLMTTDFIAVPVTLNAGQTIERLREREPEADSIYYVYVIDEQEHLLGVLSLRDLIVAKPGTPIADLMIRRVVSVPSDASTEDVAAVMSKYNLLAVPVVDREDRIQGMVTIDDALDTVIPATARRKVRAL